MDSLNKELKNKQVGGTHYKGFEIEPLEFIERNGIGFAAGNVIKYVCRAPFKNGLEDLLKAKHYLEYMIAKECAKLESAIPEINPIPNLNKVKDVELKPPLKVTCGHDFDVDKSMVSFDPSKDK